MSSVCISNCVNDTRDPRVPVRATYVNLYKWPESDAEFVRSVTSRGTTVRRALNANAHAHAYGHPRVVDSISCRQMYLRSYTFSREEENAKEKTTTMCFGRGKEKEKTSNNINSEGKRMTKKDKEAGRSKRKCMVLRKLSCSALLRIFYRLLSCSATASVDVVDPKIDFFG